MKVTRHDFSDPRSFVKSAPLPLPSHQGVKIQARTLDIYNASIPSIFFICLYLVFDSFIKY